MHVVPYGESALLLELPDLLSVHATYRTLRADAPAGVVDLVPGARTLLVVVDPDVGDPAQVAARLRVLDPAPAEDAAGGGLLEIPVVYDGEDLHEVAELAGLPVTEVVSRHSEPEYVVGFCGFAPGFAYLLGLDPRLRVPRRDSPRTRVPAGAVAVAGEYSAVYPRPSPGGWRLLGHTDVELFDVSRTPPALLVPMTRVRFRPVPP